MLAADVFVSPVKGLNTSEDGGYAIVSFVLTQQPTANVTIPLSSSNSQEGVPTVGSVVFTPANWNISQNVRVNGVADGIKDKNVKYNLITGNAVSTDPAYNGLEVKDPQLTNRNSRTLVAGYTMSKTSGLTTTEDGGTASFDIRLNYMPKSNVTISIASDNTKEGVTNVSQLVFTPSNYAQPQTVVVTGVADGIKDGTKDYTIVTGNAVSSDPLYNGMVISDVKVKNKDTALLAPIIVKSGVVSLPNSGSQGNFTIVLSSQPTANVTVPIWSSNPAVGQPNVNSVTFSPANWNTPQTVFVSRTDNDRANHDIMYSIVTGAATSADLRFAGINPSDVLLTNKMVTGVKRFDGNYGGTYQGRWSAGNVTGFIDPVNISVTIENGVIKVNGEVAGTVNSTGVTAFALTSGVYLGATFQGSLSPDGDFGMSGMGTWKLEDPDFTASGTWNIERA